MVSKNELILVKYFIYWQVLVTVLTMATLMYLSHVVAIRFTELAALFTPLLLSHVAVLRKLDKVI